MLKHTVQLLQARHDPEEVQAERQAMHFATVALLVDNAKAANELCRRKAHKAEQSHPDWQKLQRHRTVVDERTTTSLISRLAHPEFLMVPALPHHNGSTRGPINYDNLLVQIPPASTADKPANFYRTQDKTNCIGACPKGKASHLEKYRKAYAPAIHLVAGHCDFGFTYGSSQDNFPLTSMLIEEAFGDPSPETLATLNEASTKLLHTITTDEKRRGLYGL